MDWCKPHYLDASALVKLVAEDPDEESGRDAFRKYYWSHTASLYATSYCFTEALSVFKGKYLHHKITEDQYIECVRKFIRLTVGANLRVGNEVSILLPEVADEAERLIKAHKIDFLDAFQLVTILHGPFQVLGPNSKSILITADEGLAKAARAENVRVWQCRTEPAPDEVVVNA